MLLLILSFLIFLMVSLQVNRYLHYKQWLDWFLGGFLIFIAQIILVMTLSGLFYQMNNPVFVLGFQCVLLVLSTAINRFWLIPKEKYFPFVLPGFKTKIDKKNLPIVAFFVVSLGVAILNLVYVLFVPPNNNDSLAIHLARVGMWDQFGSWLP